MLCDQPCGAVKCAEDALLSLICDQPCGAVKRAEDAFGSPRGQLATASARSACPRGNPPCCASEVSFETPGFSGVLSPFFQSACPRGNPPSDASAVLFMTSGLSGSLSPPGTNVAETTGPFNQTNSRVPPVVFTPRSPPQSHSRQVFQSAESANHQHIFRRASAVIQPASNISFNKRRPLFSQRPTYPSKTVGHHSASRYSVSHQHIPFSRLI